MPVFFASPKISRKKTEVQTRSHDDCEDYVHNKPRDQCITKLLDLTILLQADGLEVGLGDRIVTEDLHILPINDGTLNQGKWN